MIGAVANYFKGSLLIGHAFLPERHVCSNKIIKICDAETGDCLQRLNDQTGSIVFSADGKRMAVTNGVTTQLWNCLTWSFSHSFQAVCRDLRMKQSKIVFSSDNRFLFSSAMASSSGKFCIDDCESGARLHDLTVPIDPAPPYSLRMEAICCFDVHPNNSSIAFGVADHAVRIFNCTTSEWRTLRGHSEHISRIAYSADGTKIASAGNGTLKVWDHTSGTCIFTAQLAEELIYGLSFGADDQWIVSASRYGALQIWDATNGACLETKKISGGIYELIVSGDRIFVQTLGHSIQVMTPAFISRPQIEERAGQRPSQ